jgi:hypothetical protein
MAVKTICKLGNTKQASPDSGKFLKNIKDRK